jgi:hypothetical protein
LQAGNESNHANRSFGLISVALPALQAFKRPILISLKIRARLVPAEKAASIGVNAALGTSSGLSGRASHRSMFVVILVAPVTVAIRAALTAQQV